LELYALLKEENTIDKFQRVISSLDATKAKKLVYFPLVLLIPWKHQEKAFEEWKKNGRKGIIEMATATGKTLVGLMAIEELAKECIKENKEGTVRVLAHSRAILDQWRREAIDKLGLIDDIYCDYTTPISCENLKIYFHTIQKVIREGPERYSADLLIVDEVHHIAAPEFSKVLKIDYNRFMGLSASPDEGERSRIFRDLRLPVIFRFDLKQALEQGVLPTFEWKLHPVYLSIEEEREFEEISRKITKLFSSIANDSEIIKKITDGKKDTIEDLYDFVRIVERARLKGIEIPDNWKLLQSYILQRRWIIHRSKPKLDYAIELAKHYSLEKKVIVFAMDIESCNLIAEELAKDVSNVFIVHSDVKDVNERIIDFKKAKSGVLIGARMLDEGIDIPDAEIGINVSSSRTRLQLIQRLGRILRKKKEKRPVFHHFVGLPSPEAFIREEDTLRFLDEISWVQDAALRMGVSVELEEESSFERLRVDAEEMIRKRYMERRPPILPSYGTFRLEKIMQLFSDEAKKEIVAILDKLDPGHRISDKEWSEIVRKGFGNEAE